MGFMGCTYVLLPELTENQPFPGSLPCSGRERTADPPRICRPAKKRSAFGRMFFA